MRTLRISVYRFLLVLLAVTLASMEGMGQSGSEPSDTLTPPGMQGGGRSSRTSGEPLFELTLHGGLTTYQFDDDRGEDPRLGLRFAQLLYHPSRNLYLWGQYDDGLSLDNPGLADRGINAPAYYAGGFLTYATHHTTRLEVGYRTLPDSVSQPLLRAEQVYTTSDGKALKLGGWLGFRSDDRLEWILHTGVNLPLRENLRIEPAFFYSRTGIPDEYQWRAFLGGEYTAGNRAQLSAGLALGQLFVGQIQEKRGIVDGFVGGTLPITSQLKAHAIARHEVVENSVSITSFVLGLTINSGSLSL